jgi:hypothetical protein
MKREANILIHWIAGNVCALMLFMLTGCGGGGGAARNPSSELENSAGQVLTSGNSLNVIMAPYGLVQTEPSGKTGLSVPVRVIFLETAQNHLTTQPQQFANQIVEKLNQKMEFNANTKMMNFVLDAYEQIVDEQYVFAACSDIDAIGTKYFTSGVLTVVVNAQLDGTCAGVTYLYTHVRQRESLILVEFDNAFYAVVHEFGHTVGLPHTAVAQSNSGLHKFSDLLTQVSSSPLRCDTDFYYLLDNHYNNTNALANGLTFNSGENLMYYSFNQSSLDRSFYTSGYDYSFSWAFHCWHKLNQGFFRYSNTISGI